MEKIKLKINGLAPETMVLITLLKSTIEKQYIPIYDDDNKLVDIIETDEIVKEEVDLRNIYYKDYIPENGIIELPKLLKYKKLFVRARHRDYREFEYKFILVDNTQILIPQIAEVFN